MLPKAARVLLGLCAGICPLYGQQATSCTSTKPCILQKRGAWDTLKLTNTAPTDPKDFGAALPIGNGRLGAKLLGIPANDTIYLNDTTLWSGGPEHDEDPRAREALVRVREALSNSDYVKADQLVRRMEGRNNAAYEPLGALHLIFRGHDSYKDYTNTLDLSTAVVTTRYTVGGTSFTREMFASYPAQVIVIHLTANQPASLSFSTILETQLHPGNIHIAGDEITVTGRAPVVDGYEKKNGVEWDDHKGMAMETILHVSIKGGSISPQQRFLNIEKADEATLIISAATSFNGFNHDPATEGKDSAAIAQGFLARAVATPYAALLQAHLDDYESLFRRLWVSIDGEAPNKYALAYQWARYALIAASRPGSGAPRNEQGIWNRDISPHYASNFTLNENPEKYYSVAEPANLGETVMPLVDFIGDLARNGAVTARVDYGFHGWVAHHNTDIWAMTTMAPGDPAWATWPVGGIWLCQSLWEHYAFTPDRDYLATKAYPVMKGAAEFALDLLVADKDGHLVTSPSTSPENHFIDPNTGQRVAVSRGSTMDMALIRQLLQNTIEASQILNIDSDFRKRLEDTLPRLLPFQVGHQGQLQEWSSDFKEFEPTHRHVSQLVAVWPLSQITAAQPDLFIAARKSLELRGPGGYHPDKAGMWARLLDGDKTLDSFRSLTFPTLYDAPMGGFAELLIQSQTGVINLLPALPRSWKKGEVLGLRARGNYEVDIHWANHELVDATIRSFNGQIPVVQLAGKPIDVKNDARIHIVLDIRGQP